MIWRLSFSQRTAILLLAVAFLLGTAIRFFQSQRAVPEALQNQLFPDSAAAADFRERAHQVAELAEEISNRPININTATRAQLQTLSGIGPVLSQRIIDYREKHGDFKTVEELDDVYGIGPKRLEAMRDRVTVETDTSIAKNDSTQLYTAR
ncbi:helix-hairpin-helix domain-containing protein [bacterium]|nr:helix-hairpin-helix domain-containing protein [bacterium]